jgi:hypothetical protein
MLHRGPDGVPAGGAEAPQTDEPAETVDATAGETPPDAEALKASLLKAVEERARRAESAVVRSMAEQSGVPEETLAEMLASARKQQAQTLPPEAQERLNALNADVRRRLTMAEVKNVGAEMGLRDAEVALSLLDVDALTVDGDGSVNGVREALESLKARKGYLFAAPGRGAWAQRVSAGGEAQLSGVEEAFYRKNPALRR